MEKHILKKLTIGIIGCNCYLVGSQSNREVLIIDPGAEPELILERISHLKVEPIGIILTHGHPDHTGGMPDIRQQFDIPLLYNKKEYKSPISTKADRWLSEGDVLSIGNLQLHVLETGGHSTGGISLFSKDITSFRFKKYGGVIFTGDLIFRRSVGRTDLPNGNRQLLFGNISDKIIYNQDLSENFLILAGHMGLTTIEEEKRLNPFGKFFLTEDDWKKNKYYNKDLKSILNIQIDERP